MPVFAITFTFEAEDDFQARNVRRGLQDVVADQTIAKLEFDSLQRRGDVPHHSWFNVETSTTSELR